MGRIFEIMISLAMVGTGVFGWVESMKIKDFTFDPLGSRAVPQTLSGLLVLAGCWIILQRLLHARLAMQPATESVADAEAERPTGVDYARAVGMFLLAMAFAYAVFELRIPLSLCVLVFCLAGAQLLVPVSHIHATLLAVVVGVTLGFGAEWIFTNFFFVDLPTLW